MKLTTNFSKAEFDSKDGAEMPSAVLENIKALAVQLQVIREFIQKPIHINSGYRSPQHNARVGGSKNSYHITGMATDIRVDGMTPTELANVVTALMVQGKIKQGGIGRYSTFVHYDTRGSHVRFK